MGSVPSKEGMGTDPMPLFVAAFSVPRMRASVSSVVLYFGMLKYAGTVPQPITSAFWPRQLALRSGGLDHGMRRNAFGDTESGWGKDVFEISSP